MRCYECSRSNKNSDTVAICIVCGRGVCKQHMVREDSPVWEGEYSIRLKCGMGVECKYEDTKRMLKIMCITCHNALKENY